MHRSGTSCLTGILEKYGAYISSNTAILTRDNLKGNKEDPKVFKLNDRILAHNGYQWYKPPLSSGSLKINDTLKNEIADYKKSLVRSALSQPIVIKDPRMIFCLKFWINNDDKLIGTFRKPQAVVKSLRARNNSLEKPLKAEWLRTWIRYNRELLDLQNEYKFSLLNFDWEQSHYEQTVKKIAEKELGLNANDEKHSFYEKTLIHHRESGNTIIESIYAKEVYEELLKRI